MSDSTPVSFSDHGRGRISAEAGGAFTWLRGEGAQLIGLLSFCKPEDGDALRPIMLAAPELFRALDSAIPALEAALEAAQKEWDEKHETHAFRPALLRPVEEARLNLEAARVALSRATGGQHG